MVKTGGGFSKPMAPALAACLLALGGCEAIALVDLYLSSPRQQIVGGEIGALMYIVRQAGPDDLNIPEGGGPTPKDLFALDLETLEATEIFTGIPAVGYVPLAANGKHIAASTQFLSWFDVGEGAVMVRDLDTGDEWRALDDNEDAEPDGAGGNGADAVFNLTIVEQRLVIHRRVQDESNGSGHEFVVVDLDTRQHVHLADSLPYPTFALTGDSFALMSDRDVDVAIRELELGTHIDLVNLATGERQRIVENTRVPGDGGALFFDEGALWWEEYRGGTFELRIRRYDLESGDTRTVAVSSEDGEDPARLAGVRDGRLLFVRMSDPLSAGQTIQLEARPAVGGSELIESYTGALLNPLRFLPKPRFVGDLLVWVDCHTGEFVILDPNTGGMRRFDPLAP